MAREYGDMMTFKDKDSIVGNFFGGIKRGMNLQKEFGLGDILLKYARTGGVLFARSVEFSPIGFITSYRHIAKAKYAYENNKTYTKDVQREVEMSIARALFGTIGFTGLGYMLASLGIISGSDDDDDYLITELRKNIGLGRYQINIDALFRWATSFDKEQAKPRKGDKMFTYDWAMPVSMSITFGVDLQKNIDKNNNAENFLSDAVSTTVASFDSMMNMFNQSNLTTGIRNLFKGYDQKKNFATLTQNSITGFTGTFNNQLRQYLDNVYRDTSSDNFVEETINKIKYRLPGLSQTLPEQMSITGQVKEIYQNNSNNFFNVFINPGFLTEYEPTPGIDLILGLYNEFETLKVVPNQTKSYLTIDSVKVPLTEQETKMYAEIQGRATMEAIERLAVDSEFKKLSKENQVKRIEKVIDKIADQTRKELRSYVTNRVR